VRHSVEGKQPHSIDFRVIWPDGSIHTVHEENDIVLGEDGEVVALIGTTQDVTESRAIADRLSETAARLARAQQTAKIGNWEWTIATGQEYWSDQMYRNFGLDPGSIEATDDNFYKQLHPDDREGVRQALRATIETGKPYCFDFRVVWPDGTERLVHEEGEALLGGDGETVGLAGTMQDVTEMRASGNHLRRLTLSFANAQRIAHIGSWDWDAVTKTEWWSDEVYRIMGLEPGAVTSGYDMIMECTHPDDREKVGKAIEAAQSNLESYDVDFRIVRPDGGVRVVRETGECVLDAEGRFTGLTGTVQDITGQHNAEQMLAGTAHRLKEAERIALLGGWEWDPQSDRLTLSDQTYRLIGLEPGSRELTNDDYRELVHPKDRQSVADLMRNTVESGGSYSTRYRIVRPDGGVRTVAEIAESFEEEGNGQRRLKGTIQDITELHRAERELSETARRLGAATRLAHLGDWVWDPDSNKLKMSEETLRICGLGPEHAEVDNDFLMAMIPEEEHGRVLAVMDSAISGKGTYTNEYHIVRPDGDARTVLEHGEAFHDETTGQIRLVGTIQDITERQRAKEELARTLKRLADAQTAARIGNWEWDAETNQDWWSEQQFRNYGIEAPAGFVASRNFLQFAHPADREAAQQAVDRSVETGAPLDMEFRATGADGVERMLWVYGVTEADADGRVIRTVGTTQDVTVRKLAEQELAITAERLEEAQRIARNWQ
jgi:PAS domain S-box-containing protein